MVLKEIEIPDGMYTRGKYVTIRYDDEQWATLACASEYDVMLSNYDSMSRYPDSCRVVVPRQVEVSDGKGNWKPYPTVVLVRCVDEHGLRQQTIALVRITGQEELSVVYSKNLEPDLLLFKAVKQAGIHTEIWEQEKILKRLIP